MSDLLLAAPVWISGILPDIDLFLQGAFALLAIGLLGALIGLLIFANRRFKTNLRAQRDHVAWAETQIQEVDAAGKKVELEIEAAARQQDSLRDQMTSLARERDRVAALPVIEMFFTDEYREVDDVSWLVRVQRFADRDTVEPKSGPLERIWREGRYYIVFGRDADDAYARARRHFPTMRGYEVDQVMTLDHAQVSMVEGHGGDPVSM
jgi:hypothetical protein